MSIVKSVEGRLPQGPRVAVIGSTHFHHPRSHQICIDLGRLLATLPDFVLMTGGMEGVGETVGRSYYSHREKSAQAAAIIHLLPEGSWRWDYGETIFVGQNAAQRREVLGRIASIYLVIEGGPGTRHEADVAEAHGAMIIPVGHTGGHACELYHRSPCATPIPRHLWDALETEKDSTEATAEAIKSIVTALLHRYGRTR